MSHFEFNPDEADDEFSTSDTHWSGRDASIFLIDASAQMFLADEEEEDSPFIKAFRCVHSSVSRKIIGNDQDYYAVVLFNTIKANNALDFENIFVLQDLKRPGAERMMELEKILEDPSFAKNKFGSSTSANIHETLWVCRSIIVGSKSNLMSKNVLLFTCVDNPHGEDELKRRQAIKGGKDLHEGGIDLEILPLSSKFDSLMFYKELLTQDLEEDSDSLSVLANPADRFDELLNRVRRLEHKQRSSGKLCFTLAPGVQMGVKVFTVIRKAYKPGRVKLYKVTNEEVFCQRKEYLESGELLMPSDIVKYQEVAGKKIKFTVDEVKAMSKIYDSGIELIGFKPLSALKPDHYVRPAHFIYPDESSVKGSTTMFSCLLERCVARGMCPVARVVAREGGSVSWAFLVPQEEVKDQGGCQEKPPGFHICYLPFADDFRRIDLPNRARANSDQVNAAKEMLKKLHFKYSPEAFDNPDLQTHWRNVEALALNRHYLEPVTDYTVPNYAAMEKKAGRLTQAFKSMVLSSSYDPDQVMKKRAAPGPSKVAQKKPKFDPSSLSVEEMAKQRKVDKLTMDAMRKWLQDQGVRVTGKKKAQLVQDVYDFLGIEV